MIWKLEVLFGRHEFTGEMMWFASEREARCYKWVYENDLMLAGFHEHERGLRYHVW